MQWGDTQGTPFGYGTYGSRSLAVGGVAIKKSVDKIKEKARKLAAHMLEANEADIEVNGADYSVKGSPDKAKTMAAAVAKGGDFAAAATAEGFTTGSLPLFSRAEPPKERGTLPGAVLLAALQTPADQVAEPVRAEVRVRYRHTAAAATITPLPDARARIVFDEPQRAITPGQGTVFYRGDEVVGGGWIVRS